MRNILLFLVFASIVSALSTAAAGVIGVEVDPTGTSASLTPQYLSPPPLLSTTGDVMNMTPADLAGTILVDSQGGDPSIDIENIIYNHSGSSWNSYLATIALNQPFTIDIDPTDPSPFINQPTDWSFVVTPPTFDPSSGDYIGSIQLNGGTPVQSIPSGHSLSNELDFGYTLSFSGTQSPTFTQTLSPVPEPSTLALFVAGAIGVLGNRWRIRRQRRVLLR